MSVESSNDASLSSLPDNDGDDDNDHDTVDHNDVFVM